MNNFSIRKKFFILGIIGAISLSLLAILTLSINDNGFKNLQNVFNDFKKVQTLQNSYIAPLFSLREITLTLVMSPNHDYKTSANKRLEPLLESLEKTFKTESDSLYKKWSRYKNLLETTRNYALKGFDEGSFMNAISTEREAFFDLINTLKTIQTQRVEEVV
jgi:hypothetical protein